MKKKTIANIVMTVIIIAIAAAGILSVGSIQGWFDRSDGSNAVLNNIRGIVNIQRDGISYPAENGTVLRSGDKLLCSPGTVATVQTADGYLTLSNSAVLEITDPSPESFAAAVQSGEVFANIRTAVRLSFDGKEAQIADCVVLLSVRSGAQTISVFSGTAEGAHSGQAVEWIHQESSIKTLSIHALNDFAISQLRSASKTNELYFSLEALDALEQQRWEEKQQQLQQTQPPETQPPETQPPETQPPATTEPPTDPPTEPVFPTTETTAPQTPSVSPTQPPETQPPATEPPQPTEPETTVPPAVTDPPETQIQLQCTITIRCDTILDNWENLDPAKAGYVPESGCILRTVTVTFQEGDTVFDVLKQVCTKYGIQLEYSWTPMYDSYYIEGINHLYEFDCGFESGWMYKVNGWFPNYGCSSYTLKDGDVIVWCYTCNGLGQDVGAGGW